VFGQRALHALEPAGLHECVQEAVAHGGGFRQPERLHRRPQRLRFLESHAGQLQAPASGEAGRGSTVRVVIHRGEHQADGQCVVQLDASELGRRGADEQWIAGARARLKREYGEPSLVIGDWPGRWASNACSHAGLALVDNNGANPRRVRECRFAGTAGLRLRGRVPSGPTTTGRAAELDANRWSDPVSHVRYAVYAPAGTRPP